MEKVGLRPCSIEDRDPIPLNQKGGTLFRICTATLLSETLFSLPIFAKERDCGCEKREKCVSTERQFRRSAVRFFVQVCGLSFFLWPTKGMFALSLAASQQKASSRGKRRPLNAEGKADHSPGREKKGL